MWQSEQADHLPGGCLLPAEIGNQGVWLKVEGIQALVVWHGVQSVGNPVWLGLTADVNSC